MVKAFGYIRVSTQMQANFGYSLSAQDMIEKLFKSPRI